jgi:hypothetical protein
MKLALRKKLKVRDVWEIPTTFGTDFKTKFTEKWLSSDDNRYNNYPATSYMLLFILLLLQVIASYYNTSTNGAQLANSSFTSDFGCCHGSVKALFSKYILRNYTEL